ncbi:MAG TPA: hypothetical protein VL048_13900 [Xanthobacteraceae bacterium]|nr:hypothetical protein [Xanthobacteraceae bacterium]
MRHTRRRGLLPEGILAGAAGGLAEVAWVSLYAGATGGDPTLLARGVTTAAGVSGLLPASPVALGVAVHMTLAMVLGVVLAFAWSALREARPGLTNPYPLMLMALVGIWAVNFFVVLPIVSPAFVHLVPYTVSLTSKLLFGLAAATSLRWQAASELQPVRLVRK